MAYCDLEGVEHDLIMPSTMIKTPATVRYVQDSEDETIFYEVIDEPAVYYDGTETGKVHCTGTYTKNYGLRLRQAGLNLMDYSSNGYSFVGLPGREDIYTAFPSNDSARTAPLLELIVGDCEFWLDYGSYGGYAHEGKVPYESTYVAGGVLYEHNLSAVWFSTDYSLRAVIQVDIDLINVANN